MMHFDIHNGYNEVRTIIRGAWAGDTFFYFDEAGLSYEHIGTEPDTFEQVSSGDRWEEITYVTEVI